MLTQVVFSFVSKFGIALAGFVLVMLTSHYFGAEGRGEISLITTTILFFNMFQDVLSGSTLINLTRTKSSLSLLYQSLIWSLIVCSVGFFILYAGAIRSEYLYWIPILALVYGMINTCNALITGHQKVNHRNALMLLLPILILTLVYVFKEYLIKQTQGIDTYVYALMVSYCIVLFFSFRFLFPNLNWIQKVKLFDKEVLQAGLRSQFGHIVNFLNYRLSFYIILAIAGKASLGIYAIAILITESLWMIGNSLSQILHMRVSANPDSASSPALLAPFIRISFWLTLPSAIVVALFPESWWIYLLGESEFGVIHQYLLFLIPSMLAMAVSTVLSHFFHAIGKYETVTLTNAIGLGVNLILLYPAIHYYGIYGAIITTNLSYLAMVLFNIRNYQKQYRTVINIFQLSIQDWKTLRNRN